jgi:hypothetical protein
VVCQKAEIVKHQENPKLGKVDDVPSHKIAQTLLYQLNQLNSKE